MMSIASSQSFGMAVGKIVWGGWPVDIVGARRTLWPSMLLLAVLVAGFSRSTSAPYIGLAGFLIEFASTTVFPAHTQFVSRWWPKHMHAQGFAILGTASRTGDITSKFLFGALLRTMRWQEAALVASGLCGMNAIA